MNMHFFLYLLMACLVAFKPDADTSPAAHRHPSSTTQGNGSQAEVQEVTLCSRASHKETGYGKSAFSFKHGLRSDTEDWLRLTHNDYDLLYGNISTNNDSDWFCVSMGGYESSRIKDLGALEWSDLQEVPVLPAIPHLSSGVRLAAVGESWEVSSEGRVTRAALGHMYVVHIKNLRTDHYAMFRADALKTSDSCTLTWMLVPSPEKLD